MRVGLREEHDRIRCPAGKYLTSQPGRLLKTTSGTPLHQKTVVIVRSFDLSSRSDGRNHLTASGAAKGSGPVRRSAGSHERTEFGERASERMWKSEGLFAEAKQTTVWRGPSIEDDQKCRSRRISARLCRTSSACSSHFIAGCSLLAFLSCTERRAGNQPIHTSQFDPSNDSKNHTFSTRPNVFWSADGAVDRCFEHCQLNPASISAVAATNERANPSM